MLSAEVENRCDDMTVQKINPAAFHLIGRTTEDGFDNANDIDLQPALYASVADLTKLRHDFPVVLGDYDGVGNFVRSLSDIVDDVLKDRVPQGVDGEFVRQQVLCLEREIRLVVAQGAGVSLVKAWDLAVAKLRTQTASGMRPALDDCLEKIEDAFRIEGQLVDCNGVTPMAMIRQAWAIEQRAKAHVSRKKVDDLILSLTNILGAEIKKSAQALSPENLKNSVGSSFESAFNFEAMSEVLTPNVPRDVLPDDRRQRIRSVLGVLKAQRFFKSAQWSDKKGRRDGPYSFLFRNTISALRAIRSRVGNMVDLIRAISIAELEIANRYHSAKHDAFFASFDETSLTPEDMALFPTYLIGLDRERHDAAEIARVLELLSSGMSVKILAQVDDILDGLAGSGGLLPFSDRGWHLANMAVGLSNVFVLQSASSNLYKMRDKIWHGLTFSGPALFSVFSGGKSSRSDAPPLGLSSPGASPYMVSAAATESRAFPTFSYDPSSGADLASRFSIEGNPQMEKDWSVHTFSYEDQDLQRLSEDIIFTYVEFAASDKRFSKYFAIVPREQWTDDMVPVADYMDGASGNGSQTVPYVLMIDNKHMLYRLVVDERMINAARRCKDMWHGLQEMGGLNNSHALKLLDQERQRWQDEKERELADLTERAEPVGKPGISEPTPEVVGPEVADAPVDDIVEVSSDEPHIDTLRCTTCNECTDVNPQMFNYNDNKQAFIADPTAGTFRELVEAAENCQVSIIHPGKPKDQNEPNLDELIERATPFN